MHTGMWGKKGFMAVKLNMSKVYDKVEWGFLEAVMKCIGFGGQWIVLIMMCVKTMNYSVIVNGNPFVGLLLRLRVSDKGTLYHLTFFFFAHKL